MKQSTLKTLALKGQEDNEALFFSSTVSNYNPPVFAIDLGYYSGGDGDRYELSSSQLLELADMINAHLQANGLPTEGKYINHDYEYSKKAYPPIGEGSFNTEEECFEGCKACTDVVEEVDPELPLYAENIASLLGVPRNRIGDPNLPEYTASPQTIKKVEDLIVKDYQKAREEGNVLPIVDKNGILNSPTPFRPEDNNPV